MKSTKYVIFCALSLLVLSGCFAEPEPVIDVEATIAAGLAATQTAMPPPTAIPTNTPEPEPTAPTAAEVAAVVETEPEQTERAEADVEPGFATNPSGTFVITIYDDGSRLYEVPASNFSIEFPSHYETLDPADSEMLEALLEEAISETLFSTQQMASFAASGIKLYSVNTLSESIRSTNPATINIIRQELPIELALEDFIAANEAQLPQLLDITSEIAIEYITLGNQPAATLSYFANIPMPGGGTAQMANTQYMVFDPDNAKVVYIVTAAMEEGLLDTLGDDLRNTAESFRLLNDE